MELKCRCLDNNLLEVLVLIIPYGIEMKNASPVCQLRQVLIIPYGIEISPVRATKLDVSGVLIIPYGIEITETLFFYTYIAQF